MEAAFFPLQQRLLHVPDVGVYNVKQCRAFLWNAAWLQHHMIAKWIEEDKLPASERGERSTAFEPFALSSALVVRGRLRS